MQTEARGSVAARALVTFAKRNGEDQGSSQWLL